jgi:uncharacterized protein YbjT (DUF2867 family)
MRPLGLCILGGTGFVGRALATRLVRDGHRVRILSRHPERARALQVLPTVELRGVDVHDETQLAREFRGTDAVINLVGILNERGRDGSGFRRVHTELTAKVIHACQTTGVPLLLQMSGLNADAERGPSHYLRSKGRAEALIRERCAGGPAWAIFRPSVIFGPEDSFINRFAGLLLRIPVPFPLACADAQFAPVYVQDVCEAFAACLERTDRHGRSYDLCGPERYTLEEIVKFTARCLGLHRAVVPLPDSIARLQAAIFDFVPGKPFSTDNYLSATVPSVCADDGFAGLDIVPEPMSAVVPRYLPARWGRAPPHTRAE